jgi:choline dehydrogenase
MGELNGSTERYAVDSDIFDYIVVGTGAAGATLAEGLSRRTRGSVLVLESGGPDRDPLMALRI